MSPVEHRNHGPNAVTSQLYSINVCNKFLFAKSHKKGCSKQHLVLEHMPVYIMYFTILFLLYF